MVGWVIHFNQNSKRMVIFKKMGMLYLDQTLDLLLYIFVKISAWKLE